MKLKWPPEPPWTAATAMVGFGAMANSRAKLCATPD